MRHWYVYHSQNTMGYDYRSLSESAVYSTKNQPKLCINDMIWVIEGDTDKPANYKLVDCFQCKHVDAPPFVIKDEKFKTKASGEQSLLIGEKALDKTLAWFDELHAKYITKRRYFHSITDEKNIVDGLLSLSGVQV